MKGKIFVITLLGMVISTAVNASIEPQNKRRVETVINTYIESHLNSDHKKLKSILDNDAIIRSNRNVTVLKHSAKDVLMAMKNLKGSKQQDCDISYKIISETDAMVIAQVDVSYGWGNSKQKNIVIIENNGTDWKITNIYKNYVSEEEISAA
jgi:hypothetical protein